MLRPHSNLTAPADHDSMLLGFVILSKEAAAPSALELIQLTSL